MKTKKSVVVKPIRKVHEPEDKYDTRYEETRFAVFDAETGEMLDDAQGYGYRTAKKAWAAWTYKNRDKSKDREKARKKKAIQDWLKSHKGFERAMAQYAFEIECKKSWGPDDKFDAKFVSQMLKDYGFTDLPFTAGELLRAWRS